MKEQETFYGLPIDYSDALFAAVYLAPDCDVKDGQFYTIGNGYGVAVGNIKKGERGKFYIAGNFILYFDDEESFEEGDVAAINLNTGDLVPLGSPNSTGTVDVGICGPDEASGRFLSICFWHQEEI